MFENGRSKEVSSELYLASVFVSDAQYNRNIYFDTSPQAVRLYLLYNHWLPQVLLYIFIILDLSLALFEEPAVIPLPSWATMLVELLCLLVFTLRLVHYARVIPQDKFWKDPKNICIIAIVLTLIDMIIYGALKASSYQAIRWTRVLRPLLLVNVTEGRQLRRAFRSIRNALPQIIYVFLLFLFSLLIFSLMALKLVGKRDLKTTGGAPYFSSYVDIIFDLYVLVTTANSPDVMMPAYNASSWFALFFIIYILINTYIFMSVFLAVVYNNYKKYLKEEIRQLVRAKRHKMVRAFAVLQERRKDTEEQVVSQANWNQLVRLVQPDIRNAHRELLWSVLDPQNQGCIGKVAFVQLADLLNIEVITLKSRPHPLRFIFPTLYLSVPSRLICRLVRHRTFVMVYDLIILVNAIFIGLDEDNPLIADSEWMFLSLYLLEILLKLYVFEPRAFFSRHNFLNKLPSSFTSSTPSHIPPLFSPLSAPPQVVYYIFAMVGMELFKGKIKYFGEGSDDPTKLFCGNVLLNGTSFAQLNYCKNNFNDILSSFILLVELTVVNQCSGFTFVTHVSARIFFVVFHIIVVIIIINIFVAFVLEAFFMEYSVEKSDLHTSVERKIEELQLSVAQEKLEDNLVNAMDSTEGNCDTAEDKPVLMFKIASKSKNVFI
uniref:Two pore segment channel 3 n=1 Tax=Takifugu rubripes TaxID=31033 RepID=A0A674MY26_TAKRU